MAAVKDRTGGASAPGAATPALDRRRFLLGASVAGAGGAAAAAAIHDGELGAPPQAFTGEIPWQEGAADSPSGETGKAGFLTPAERAFVDAATDRLIPPSSVGPSAVEAGVPTFIDRQLAGPFGRGDHYFLGGPWPKGKAEQGYQSRFAPAQLYRAAIAAIDRHVVETLKAPAFAKLAAAEQDKLLKALEAGQVTLSGGVEGKAFFGMLLQNTKEGYFSDPIYGGNKDLSAWKMIGFPGAHYDYSAWVTRHGERVPFPTVGFKGRPGWREA
jgi:gluconate 2-dehydrogenase gamma chain